MTDLQNIIGKIKEIEDEKNKEEESKFVRDKRILKLNKNATYIGTLLPYKPDLTKTFERYSKIGFMSPVNEKYIFLGRSPGDVGVKEDIVRNTQWAEYQKAVEAGDETARKAACKLIPQKERLVNFYLHKVIGDDTQKEKEGTVVVLAYPAQTDKEGNPSSEIFKKIHNAVWGDKAKKIGERAFDMTEKGKVLVIKVTEKAKFNNYSETEFDDIDEEMVKTKAQIEEIEKSTHNLSEFIPEVKSQDELKKLLDEYWHGTNPSTDDSLDSSETPDDDDIPGLEDTGDDDDSSSGDVNLDELLKD